MASDDRAEREWWLRTLLVLQAPRPVFAALRDDSEDAAAARAEPVLALLLLAGIATVIQTSTAGHLLDDADYDALLVAVWALIAGSVYGAAAYWVFGWFLHRGEIRCGSVGRYRRSRHVLAFASVPIVCTLGLLPVKLALYGADVFHRGGSDGGAGGKVFDVVDIAFFAWTAVLIVIGVRAVHGWTWGRSGAAVGAAAALPAAIAVLLATL
jgi:hypothetical protein